MGKKEAKARIKINMLLEEAGWRFFDDEQGKANIVLENYSKNSEKKEATRLESTAGHLPKTRAISAKWSGVLFRRQQTMMN
ncbi:hypothetical protein GF337_18415 [candidate division KSB1 bacterium]|nr:hypothetical protein [candidate division KSB1 bacterium]